VGQASGASAGPPIGDRRHGGPSAAAALTHPTRLAQKRLEQSFGGTWYHVAADELADLLRRLRTRFHGGANAADVALNDRGDEGAANANALHNLHVGGLRHCVG